MQRFRVRAKCVQTYTQFFTVEAASEAEAIEMVKNGEVPLTFERFEEVDDFQPTHAYPARDNTDLHTPAPPTQAYVVNSPGREEERGLARVA